MAQQQFAPREAPPAFGGCFAHELTKRILDIQVRAPCEHVSWPKYLVVHGYQSVCCPFVTCH